MKFNIEKILLWTEKYGIRELKFEPNKVNIITGDSGTGKSAILQIIDYCFFSSSSKISEDKINENTLWYGLRININDKKYTIARSKLLEGGSVSNSYFFSSTGEVPEQIEENNTEDAIKALLETEFNIDKDVSFPSGYGSNSLRAGSKISLRYFLMFNTISVNIIESDQDVFFDKQNESRYRDALPRIFDIATGIESLENILLKERKIVLESDLNRLRKKQKELSKHKETFAEEKNDIIKRAREFSLIDSTTDRDRALEELESTINTPISSDVEVEIENIPDRQGVEKQRFIILRKIKNLFRFSKEYSTFKSSISEVDDSLKPIEYLKDSFELVKTSHFDSLISSLTEELDTIRTARKGNTPIDRQVNDEIAKLRGDLKRLDTQLSQIPSTNQSFESERDKFIFLGEVKSKLEIYSGADTSNPNQFDTEIAGIIENLEALNIVDTEERRKLTISLIEEIITEYMSLTENSLDNYKDYLPVFDYKNKALKLRKPKTSFIENVGSSSNHMFLHLFFSLAMHEVVFANKSPFVAPFLVIDQPSRPYYGADGNRKGDDKLSDDYRISKAFNLLDEYVKLRNENGGEFQMIVFEHVPPSVFENLPNTHLVEEFWNGNALINEVNLD